MIWLKSPLVTSDWSWLTGPTTVHSTLCLLLTASTGCLNTSLLLSCTLYTIHCMLNFFNYTCMTYLVTLMQPSVVTFTISSTCKNILHLSKHSQHNMNMIACMLHITCIYHIFHCSKSCLNALTSKDSIRRWRESYILCLISQWIRNCENNFYQFSWNILSWHMRHLLILQSTKLTAIHDPSCEHVRLAL